MATRLPYQFAHMSTQASKATTTPRNHGSVAGDSAFNDPGQDLLGVIDRPLMPFDPKTVPRNVRALVAFHNYLVPGIQISPSDDGPTQQDELDLDLPTAAHSSDFLSSINLNSLSVRGVGNVSPISLTRQGRQTAPWTSEAVLGGSSLTNSANPFGQVSHDLTRPYQKRSSLGAPNSFVDEGYYTVSGPSQQDARSRRSTVTGTANNQQHLNDNRPQLTSAYPSSIAESQNSSSGSLPDNEEHPLDLGMSGMSPPRPRTCPECSEALTTPSQEKKHMARHHPQFACSVPGCARSGNNGFPTINDLERHKKSVHKIRIGQYWRCFGKGCTKPSKDWPRLDNFKNHLAKLHPEESPDALVQRSEAWWNNTQSEEAHEATPNQQLMTQAAGQQALFMGLESTVDPNVTVFSQMPWRLEHGLEGPTPWQQSGIQHLGQLHRSTHNSSLGHLPASSGSGNSFNAAGSGNNLSSSRSQTMGQPRSLNTAGPRLLQEQQLSNGLTIMQEEMLRAQIQHMNSPTPSPHPSSGRTFLLPPATKRGVRTAPNPDVGSLTDVESPLPSGSSIGSINATGPGANDLAQIGSYLDTPSLMVGTDSLGNIGSTARSPLTSNDTNDQSLHQTLQKISALLKSSSGSTDSIVRTLAQIQELLPSQNKSSKSVAEPAASSPVESGTYRTGKDQDGKEIFYCPHENCERTSWRKSELNKHVKRHNRPYACTFDNCYKKFGSKNDLKRHEHSQHEQLEVWRCEESTSNTYGDPPRRCPSLWPTKTKFMDHLRDDHQKDEDTRRDLAVRQRIGRRHQGRFWCGFCRQIIMLNHKGIPGDNERFDHLCNHFLGTDCEKADIQDWLPAEGIETKGQIKARKVREDEKALTQKLQQSQSSAGAIGLSLGLDTASDDSSEELSPTSATPSHSRMATPSGQRNQPRPMGPHLSQHQGVSSQLQTPPRTVSKKRAAPSTFSGHSDDLLDTQCVPSSSRNSVNSGSRDNARKHRRVAEFAICCQCQPDVEINRAETELLANSTKCIACQHRFCKGCRYI